MSLSRGIQSAIFFYLSCAPCTGYSHRKRRRKEAHNDRILRRELEMEQPDLYSHPSPFATNPHWDEEIAMGPGPPPQRLSKKQRSRAITTASTQDTIGSTGSSSLSGQGLPIGDAAVQSQNQDLLWNVKRYQREEEDLWGPEEQDFRAGADRYVVFTGTSIGRAHPNNINARRKPTPSYFIARNPSLNDLHPPACSIPSPNLADTRWMLQPPPSARIMNGKIPVRRGRTDTKSSRSTTNNSSVDTSLVRRIPSTKTSKKGRVADLQRLQRTSSDPPPHNTQQYREREGSRSLSRGRKRRPAPLFTGGSSKNNTSTTLVSKPTSLSSEAITSTDFAHPDTVGSKRPRTAAPGLREAQNHLTQSTSLGGAAGEKENSPPSTSPRSLAQSPASSTTALSVREQNQQSNQANKTLPAASAPIAPKTALGIVPPPSDETAIKFKTDRNTATVKSHDRTEPEGFEAWRLWRIPQWNQTGIRKDSITDDEDDGSGFAEPMKREQWARNPRMRWSMDI